MKYFKYSAFPFGRLLVSLLVGRLISIYLPFSSFLFWILISVVISGVVVLIAKIVVSYSKRWLLGVVICVSLFSVGLINKPNYSFSHKFFAGEYLYQATVYDVTKNTSSQQSLILHCSVINNNKQFFFPVLAYVKKDTSFYDFLPGDKLVFKSKLLELKSTGNPYAFEYAHYMQTRGVHGQLFLRSKEFLVLGSAYSHHRFFYQVKQWAKQKLRHLNLDVEEFGIVSALVLGDKSYLEYNTKTNFSSSGAIHVLSVSGLHVGILYLLLISLFGKINKGFLSSLKVIVILLVLWFYASITGMSPSVFRATIMFTVFLIARWQNHNYNIYHSLAIAAFIIIIINPYAIIHAGFWLSFFAVASIVYFYPRIFKLFYFRTPWAKYIWALISVSFAAQIGTFPLGIYLFGFFPTWFLLSNLLIIPILPIVLLGSLFVIIFPFESIPIELIHNLLQSTIIYMNDITKWIGDLPFAQFTQLQLVFYEMILAYLSLVFVVVWQQFKSGKFLIYALSFLFLTVIFTTYKSYVKCYEVVFAVHQVKGKTAISFTTKNEGICLTRSSLNVKDINQSVRPLWLAQETGATQQLSVNHQVLYPVYNSKTFMLVVNGYVKDINSIVDTDEVDVFVFTSSLSVQSIKSMVNYMQNSQIVFDSSFSTFKSKLIQKELRNYNLLLHFVSLDGAYVMLM